MKTYHPYLRGKQNELFALRELAKRIAASGHVVPIIEPIKPNTTTRNSFDAFVSNNMPFILVTNPSHGDFVGKEAAVKSLVADTLWTYDNYIAAYTVERDTKPRDLEAFEQRYDGVLLAAIYRGEPANIDVRNRLFTNTRYYHHAFVGNRVARDFQNEFPQVRRINLEDHFKRQQRNADFPGREFFTDMNTSSGNSDDVAWGDFSIVGDHFTEKGGAAHAVALHHVHYADENNTLEISHFVSDRVDTTADRPGKTLEALSKLVAGLDVLAPNDTDACAEYRELEEAREAPSLGYMKKLAIKQHLEVVLGK